MATVPHPSPTDGLLRLVVPVGLLGIVVALLDLVQLILELLPRPHGSSAADEHLQLVGYAILPIRRLEAL
jgi:hypothetical protein